MALTLPYPNMNFVPLDVLTASEQNHLVANIEYIANQFPVTGTNIDPSSVSNALVASPVTVADVFTLSSGYTAPSSTTIYKQGGLLQANLVFNGTFTGGSQMTVATWKNGYMPLQNINTFCGFSNSEWDVNAIGYCFITGSSIIVRTSSTYSYCKVSLTTRIK